MQYNQTQGSVFPVYPQQLLQGNQGVNLQPPPPIPPRTRSIRDYPEFGGPQPTIGWNVGQSNQSTTSPWGLPSASSASSTFNHGNPFQDNFTSRSSSQTQSHSTTQHVNQQSHAARHSRQNSISRVLPKDSVDHKPLITLSPDSTLDKKFQHTTYSMDLEGLDFGGNVETSSGLEEKKCLSSSAEALNYPDISHAFHELRKNEQRKSTLATSAVNINFGAPTPHTIVNDQYGWNFSVINPQYNYNTSSNNYQQNNLYGIQNYTQTFSNSENSCAMGPGSGVSGLNTNRPESYHYGASSEQRLKVRSNNQQMKRPSSASEFDNLRKIDYNSGEHMNVFDDSFDFSELESNEQRERRTSDLIEFEEKEYLSLDSFDPLYSRTRKESISGKDAQPPYSFADSATVQVEDQQQCERGSTEGNYGKMYPEIEKDSFDVTEKLTATSHADLCNSAEALEKFFKYGGQEEKLEVPERPPPPRSRSSTEESQYEKLYSRMFVDQESDAFCQMVSKLKSQFKSTDSKVNRGFMVSPLCDVQQPSMSIKVVIHTDYAPEPIIFTCDIHSNVEHVICQVLYSFLQAGNTPNLSTEDFLLKVYDRSEYLLSDLPLSKYDYIHSCLKLDQDIRFMLFRKQDISLPFLRTVDDDDQQLVFPKDYEKSKERVVSKDQLQTLMNTFYKEMESLNDIILKNNTHSIHSQGLSQAVKAICTLLANIETIEISSTVKKVEDIVEMLTNQQKETFDNTKEKLRTQEEIHIAIQMSLIQELNEVLEQLLKAVNQLVKMYCHTFHTDYILGSPVRKDWSEKLATSIEDDFILHVAAGHRIPVDWTTKYDEYKVVCSLHYGKLKIGDDAVTQTTTNKKGLCDHLKWDQWLSFKDIPVSKLPRETRLCMTLCGLKGVPNGGQGSDATKVLTALGGVTIQLYNRKGYLARGSQLVPLRMHTTADPFSPYCSVLQSDTVLLQINLPDFGQEVIFPEVLASHSRTESFSQLLPSIQDIVTGVLEKDCISSCQADELEILWRNRHHLHKYPRLLPWILQGCVEWDYFHLSEIYALIRDWKTLEPMQALELLLPQYPDSKVREFAVNCLKKISSDELADFLPQLIQALKYESYHGSSLSWLLLEESCKSIRFAHQFFWLLKGAASQDDLYKRRYELMFVALVSVAGDPLYQEFRKQEEMVKILTVMAEKVQVSKDKENALRRELINLQEFFEYKGSCLLPYNPGLCVSGIEAKSCSYFTSNAVPLKLVFKNPNIKADPVYAMFKVGDDMRQDMLTMQMIKIMDRLWLKEGLDLKIITFACLATGPRRGIVELVTESDTLRKIQVQAGLTGSFKDRPIKEWLQGHNPTELEYQKAVENFTYSCAGYCVATYVLGVCDRHNDNIMLKQSGHMFHIDFNKFLGDSQMFGNFKRDRVPFVLTSDMAHVINNGEKRSDRFQHFIDICCQGFNILRRNANLFLNLFALISRSGIPGVSDGAARYIQRALLPGHTEGQASAVFTRMIEDSLKSVFTQFNFFIHNLAQLKFSSHQEGALLSFVPKTYNINTDGKLKKIEVHGYQKRYQPDKHYIYIFKVQREKQNLPSYVFRHFSEFLEFRNKLVDMFPLTPWPPPISRMVIGRSHIKTVAENRKQEVEKFLAELWKKAPEVSDSDIVYTFFHPLLRDEQEAQKEKMNMPKLRENDVQLVVQPSQYGMVKLSVQYQKDRLHIMIIHVKELPCTSEPPSPYVKTYLLPDPEKQTKRKTKVVKHSTHPTYNEVIEYKMTLEEVKMKTLQVSVWDHDVLKENNLLGAVYVKFRDLDLTQESANWYKLEKIQITDSNTIA